MRLRFGDRVMARLDELAAFSAEPDRLARLHLTAPHAAAASVQAWMTEAGMSAAIDATGNVVGRYEGREPGLVATFGRIQARPGAPNVIPGDVRFTIDLRAPSTPTGARRSRT